MFKVISLLNKKVLNGLGWRLRFIRECVFYFLTFKNWREVAEFRLHKKKFAKFYLRNGNILDIEPAAIGFFSDIWLDKVYTKFGASNLANSTTVVDIGANIGIFSFFAASVCPKAEILSFEPNPVNFEVLQKNIKTNNLSNIRVFPFAVSSMRGKTNFYVSKDCSAWSSLYAVGKNDFNKVEVETLSLADIIENTSNKRIDFLKLDCEGAEFEILRKQEKVLSECVRYISMEYHERPGCSVLELQDLLKSAGFEVIAQPGKLSGIGMLYASKRSENEKK